MRPPLVCNLPATRGEVASEYEGTQMKQRSLRVEREFGWIVGGVFTLLGAWWLFRAKFANLVPITLLLGLLLIFLGSIYPRALIYPNKAWMQLAELLGFVSTRIILGIVFFLIVTPIGAA